MARSRIIKPEFFRSEDVATLDPMARLLFAGLWTLADKEGRLFDRPRRIAADLFPYDDDPKIEINLGSLAARGLITRYEVDGKRYIQVSKFGKHQRPHPREPASEIPAPLPDVGQSRVQTRPGNDKATPICSVSNSDSLSDSDSKAYSSEPAKKPPAAEVKPPDPIPGLEFPISGVEPGEPLTWQVHRWMLPRWMSAFPSLDIEGECRKALVWVEANPGRRKTARGMKKFLFGWFDRAQNRGPPLLRVANGTSRSDEERRKTAVRVPADWKPA